MVLADATKRWLRGVVMAPWCWCTLWRPVALNTAAPPFRTHDRILQPGSGAWAPAGFRRRLSRPSTTIAEPHDACRQGDWSKVMAEARSLRDGSAGPAHHPDGIWQYEGRVFDLGLHLTLVESWTGGLGLF